MLSNKVKRNIWLTFAILSFMAVVDRAIRLCDGSIEWWQLVSAMVTTALCSKFYICYRREVKRGNLFGRVKLFR